MIHAEKNQRFISRTVSDNEVIYHMCTCIVSVYPHAVYSDEGWPL